MLFQLLAFFIAMAAGARRIDPNDWRRLNKNRRRRTPATPWVPRRRQADLNKPIDPSAVDALFAVTNEVEPAAWDYLVNPNKNPASNNGDEEPEVAYALGDILGNIADAVQNILANLDVDAIVAQIQGTIANVAEIIQNVADSIVELTEAIVGEIANLTEIVNEITAAVEEVINAINNAGGRRRMSENEKLFVQVDSLDGRQMTNLMDSDLQTIQDTNNFGPVEMQDLNNMQDHVAGTAAALNLDADALADLIANIQDKVQNAVATVLDQLANLQDVLANIANAVNGAAALNVADLEVISAANMEDMAATGELTAAELVDLTAIQDAINGNLGDISLDALAGLTPDALADLANLDLANIQDQLNLPNVADLEDVIAQIQNAAGNANVADVLANLADLKDAVANLADGLPVANLEAVAAADLAQQAQINVLTAAELQDLTALQDVLADVQDKIAANLPALPDGLNVVNLEEIAALAGQQLQDVKDAIAANANAADIQNLLDNIAAMNFDISNIQDIIAKLQGGGASTAELQFLDARPAAGYQGYMEPQLAAMVMDAQSTLETLFNRGVFIDDLPDGIQDDDLEKLNNLNDAQLNQVLSGLQSNPDIYQFRAMVTAAEQTPMNPPSTQPQGRPAGRPAMNPTTPPRRDNKGGATMPGMNGRSPQNPSTPATQPNTQETPADDGMTNSMPGMNNNMNGGMNNGMKGMDGDMDHEMHEEPPIYSNPIVLGAVGVILLGLAFFAYKKFSKKPEPESNVQAPTYAKMTV